MDLLKLIPTIGIFLLSLVTNYYNLDVLAFGDLEII